MKQCKYSSLALLLFLRTQQCHKSKYLNNDLYATTDRLWKNQDKITIYFDYLFCISTPCHLKSHGKYSISKLLSKHPYMFLYTNSSRCMCLSSICIYQISIFSIRKHKFFLNKFHLSASIIHIFQEIFSNYFVFHLFFSVVHPYSYFMEMLNSDIQIMLFQNYYIFKTTIFKTTLRPMI